MATYAHLYDMPEPGPPEGELVAEVLQPRPHGLGWGRRFFLVRSAP